MAHTENTTKNRKNKHYPPLSVMKMLRYINAEHANQEIAMCLGSVHQTIRCSKYNQEES